MKGKMCRWRGRGANEEEDVPMKRKMCQWSGICGHEGEDVPMKGKMCPWRGRCAHEEEDVPMKRKMWPWRCGNSFQEVENKSVRESISRKQASRESARKHPSTKNGLRVSLRAGCPPVYRAVTTKKNTAQLVMNISIDSMLFLDPSSYKYLEPNWPLFCGGWPSTILWGKSSKIWGTIWVPCSYIHVTYPPWH